MGALRLRSGVKCRQTWLETEGNTLPPGRKAAWHGGSRTASAPGPSPGSSLSLLRPFNITMLHSPVSRSPALLAPYFQVVRPSGSGRGGSSLSLLRLLDRCRTRPGSRLLRSSLLQPLADVDTLSMRWAG